MTKLEPGDDLKGGRIGQHGTPLCVHYVARVRLSIRARDSVDQMNQNGAAGGGTCDMCMLHVYMHMHMCMHMDMSMCML